MDNLRRICAATPLPENRVLLSFDDGAVAAVDFASLIRQGGVFAPLGDPAFFQQVRVSDDGRYIAWPGELDFCADALWEQGDGAEFAPGAR
jgi:hypothetical protein